MAVVEAQFQGLELEKVVPKITTLFERDDMFYANIKKRDVEKISNRQMRIPLEIRPGGKFQYYDANGGDLGRGGGPTWDKAVLTSVFVSENIEYTKLAQWATDSNTKAVANGVKRLIATALDELRRQLDAQLMQPGTGVIATVAVEDQTTVPGSDFVTCTTDGFGVRLMRYGQEVQVFDVNLTTNRGTATITQWDVENKTIVLTPSVAGIAATDFIVTKGIASPLSMPALFGVPYHDNSASTGNWLGFPRASNPEIRASRVNASSNPLTLPLPRLAINKIGNRVGKNNGFKPRAWMHPCQKQSYEEIGQLVSAIFKDPKDQKLNMYFDGMQMAGAEVNDHFNWDMTRIDFISDNVWGRGEILPIGFYTSDGRNIFEIRGASGGVATADIFYMTVGMQTFVNNPAACSYIDALAVPAGY